MKQFIYQNLIVAVSAVVGISIILTVQFAFAAPGPEPPLGNPTYSDGPQGPQGPQGGQGPQGNQGNQGPQGPQGGPGQQGMGWCNWNGGRWISHGWDGACAWNVGAWWYCSSGRLTHISAYTNGCNGWYLDYGNF